MANGFLVVDEKDWCDASRDQRDWMVFKTLRSMDARLQKLERWNKGFSFLGGVIGGFIAALGMKWVG